MTSALAVPFTRLDDADPELVEELLGCIARVARRAAFIGGSEVEAFEEDFARYCEAQHAVGVSSGTDALALALASLDIGPDDEVIVPANTFIATAEAVSRVGAAVRFVDVDPVTRLITADAVASAIGSRTRAVIPVHLEGRTVDLDPLVAVARAAGLRVIEDACQAHGAWYKGRRVGALGDCGAFSFYPAKNLGAWGDAGALVTNDAAIADRVRLLRSHGERPRYHHRIVGTTARLDAIQAAVLRHKLRTLDLANAARRRLADRLTRRLEATAVRPPEPPQPGTDHVFHLYVVTTDERDALRAHLRRAGIASAVHYPIPVHRSEAYGMVRATLPVTERLAGTICSLPLHPRMTEEELERVASAVGQFQRTAVAA